MVNARNVLEAVRCMLAKLLQFCLTLCNPMGHSLPGSSVHGILLARRIVGNNFLPSKDLPDPGNEPRSLNLLHWQAGSLPLALPRKPQKQKNEQTLLAS